MRSLVLVGLVGAAACSNGDTGLVLTLHAGAELDAASRVEILLANPDAVESADGQRTGGNVQYYRQQAATPAFDVTRPDGIDGLVVRVEAQDGKGDRLFIPIVIAYSKSGSGYTPIGIGALLDAASAPREIVVPAGSRLETGIDMIALDPADLSVGVLSGQIAEVRCGSNSGPWRSGIAWQLPAQQQHRLLLPMPDRDPMSDASDRALDLDCDGAPAKGGDCDDVSPRYHPGAGESCDGTDINCDGSDYALTPCDPPDAACGSTDGLVLCHDTAPVTTLEVCVGSPRCRCQVGTDCAKCVLKLAADQDVKPCSPAAAKIPIGICDPLSPCHVEVVRTDDRWDVEVAADPPDLFGSSVDATTGEIWVRVKPWSPPTLAPGASVGSVNLVISSKATTAPRYLGLDLQLATQREGCATITPAGGLYGMECTVP